MLHFTESKVFKILQIHNIVKMFFSATNELNIAKFFFSSPEHEVLMVSYCGQ